MKKYAFCLLFLAPIAAETAEAQVRVGVRVAPTIVRDKFNYTYFLETEDTVQYSKMLLGGGAFLLVGSPKGIRFLAEVEYQPARIRQFASKLDALGGRIYDKTKPLTHTIHYVAVSALTRIHTPQFFNLAQVFFDAGLRGYYNIGNEGDITIPDKALIQWNIGLRLGLGMRFEIKERLSLFWDLKYDAPLRKDYADGLTFAGVGYQEGHRLNYYALGIGIMF